MTHSCPDFATHVIGLLKNTGPSGPTGPTPANPFISLGKGGTTCAIKVGPVDFDWSQSCAATGPSKNSRKQLLTNSGTTGTGGTTNFNEGHAARISNDNPSEWYAILEELKQMSSPEWVGSERWFELIEDADAFLSCWAKAARDLNWTALDLFGVHPLAPASRFDAMGLVPLLRGGRVTALTDRTAMIRMPSWATLTYARMATGKLQIAVLLNESTK